MSPVAGTWGPRRIARMQELVQLDRPRIKFPLALFAAARIGFSGQCQRQIPCVGGHPQGVGIMKSTDASRRIALALKRHCRFDCRGFDGGLCR